MRATNLARQLRGDDHADAAQRCLVGVEHGQNAAVQIVAGGEFEIACARR